MSKGMFMQGVCILTDGSTTIEEIWKTVADAGFKVVKRVPAGEQWVFGGDSIIVDFKRDVNGLVAIDVVNQPWPDSMGDPKTDPTVFAAWSMGFFGPFAFPGGLARAQQQSWAWEGAKTIPHRSRGFIRVKISYVFGDKPDAPVAPKDYDPVAEIAFLSDLCLALLKVKGTLCYFNPNGEVLQDYAGFSNSLAETKQNKLIPLPLWSNVRLFNVNAQFGMMDTVGNDQLEIQDVEVIYDKSEYKPNEIEGYLRNVTLYLLSLNRELQSNETIDGPGENNLSWIIERLNRSLTQPLRRVLRLCPAAQQEQIRAALPR